MKTKRERILGVSCIVIAFITIVVQLVTNNVIL